MTDDTKNKAEDRLDALREKMKKEGVGGFLVPRADEFQGEFVAPSAERLMWLTGFTGSGGMAVILQEHAALLTDDRYMIQAARQVNTDFYEVVNSMKTPAGAWIAAHAPEGAVIGYDPWLHTPQQIEKISAESAACGAKLKALERNLVDEIWTDRPAPPQGPVTVFPEEIAGTASSEKREAVACAIEKDGGFCALITRPDSLCWLLNVRGSDIEYTPLVLSYGIVYGSNGDVQWFVDPKKIPDAVKMHIGDNVEIVDISHIARALKDVAVAAKEVGKPVLLDTARSPLWFKANLEKNGAEVRDFKDPCIAPKAIKTQAEQEAVRRAHIRDGIALVRFLIWLDEQGPGGQISEMDVADKLLALRAQNPEFKGVSFATIAGFGENGAVVHYRATPENNALIKPPGLLLVDSGAQYADGTTDITRTIAIGAPAQEMKENFTRVLKGHIAVATARFPAGTTGAQIDVLARRPLWDAGLNYAHGTGHGVGCYLAVHEEAASLSPRGREPLKPGMLLSNEPGYYKEGAYGIRIENLVLVCEDEAESKMDPAMLHFETISFAPIDKNLIVVEMLSPDELKWLDEYHARIYETLSPFLHEEEQTWLAAQTRACATCHMK